ncbi:MAG: D-lyxose/D-mannose family sugar isomerase [Clostridia bacterium]|nr:D-lyxose/D-mannose family sugar isomerase [Clostridia bacterium]
MKRSEVNQAIRWAEALLSENRISLPATAAYPPEKWAQIKADAQTVFKTMLGWDITDFGTGDFSRIGAVLYTVRNGLMGDDDVGVPYCEKYIVMKDGQRLPKHYHLFKSEDIINRAGGVLEVMLWNTDENGEQLEDDVTIYMDGIRRTFRAGEKIRIMPGNSISLTPRVAHIFGPEPGSGDLVVGEVSKVNDDNTDNYFLEKVGRFPTIEEDEPPCRLLCNEYPT